MIWQRMINNSFSSSILVSNDCNELWINCIFWFADELIVSSRRVVTSELRPTGSETIGWINNCCIMEEGKTYSQQASIQLI